MASISSELPRLTSKITAKTRQNFGLQHLIAAARLARHCNTIEIEHRGEPWGESVASIISYASACSLSAVASLEANINEMFADHEKDFLRCLVETVDEASGTEKEALIGRFSPVWESFWRWAERKPVLHKYQLFLDLKGLERMDEGRQPFQDASLLIQVRNALVHFKPEWHQEAGPHYELSEQLRGKFDLNPFIHDHGKFPQAHMSYGFAEWVVHSSLSFMASFSEHAGLTNRFADATEKGMLDTRA